MRGDLVVGPGLGIYKYKTNFDSNVSAENKEQLPGGVNQLPTKISRDVDLPFTQKNPKINLSVFLTLFFVLYTFYVLRRRDSRKFLKCI